MSKVLDRTIPFATVYGQPGVSYEQNGVLFNAGGNAVEESTLIPCDETPELIPEDNNEPLVLTSIVDDKPRPDEALSLSQKHWKHLKVMVEAYGGEWTNRESAVSFLKGKSAA